MTSITVSPASKSKLKSIFFSLFTPWTRVYILRTWNMGWYDIQPTACAAQNCVHNTPCTPDNLPGSMYIHCHIKTLTTTTRQSSWILKWVLNFLHLQIICLLWLKYLDQSELSRSIPTANHKSDSNCGLTGLLSQTSSCRKRSNVYTLDVHLCWIIKSPYPRI